MKPPRRPKSRRVLMAEAIRRECGPVLFGMGFRNPRRYDRYRWDAAHRDVYLRWRGANYDEIRLQWDKYNRPKFFLRFVTSSVEHSPSDGHAALRAVRFGNLYTWRGPIVGGWFGPWRTLDGVVRLVNRRVAEANDYMLTGVIGPHMMIGPPVLRGPDDGEKRVPPEMKIWGDPWLDPESDYHPGG